MTDGLKDAHREAIVAVLAANERVERAVLFGSRATGTNTVTSDVDIALFGRRLTLTDQARLATKIDEIPMAQSVDLLLYDSIQDRTLRKHIRRRGVEWYARLDAEWTVATTSGTGDVWPSMPLHEAGVSLIDCEHRTPPASEDGYPYVGIPQVKDGRIDPDGARRIAREHYREWTRKANPQPFDIVLSRRCNPGETGFVSPGFVEFALGQNLVLLRSDGKRVLKPFLRWLVRSPRWWVEVSKYINVGAVFDSLKCVDIPGFQLPIPTRSEQRAIAHILGTLDDKIELNRRMNETLEAMARALFKSWFVDFDPVRAKVEGRDTGLPLDVAALFPDRLVDSEMGEIPEGWVAMELGDLCHKPQYGYTASAQTEPIGPRFLRITDINKEPWVSWSRVPYCTTTDDEFSKYRLGKGEVLIARTADPGHGILVEEDIEAVFASYLIRFRPVERRFTRLLQYWLRSDTYWHLVRSRATGTTRRNLNATVLRGFPLVVPSDSVATAFATAVDALREQVVANVRETESLAALRDALLPKLMSGEIRIRAAEGTLEPVT